MLWPSECYAALRERAPLFRFLEKSAGDRLLREAIASVMRPGLSVVDVGCGAAVTACHLAAEGALGASYVGIDPDGDACRVAADVLAALDARQVRGHVLPMGLDAFLDSRPSPADLVVCSRALHECLLADDPAGRSELVDRLNGLVRPGGHLLVTEFTIDPAATPDERRRIDAYAQRLGVGAGRRHLERDEIDALFAAPPWRIVTRRDVMRHPLGHLHGVSGARLLLFVLQVSGR